MFDEILDFVFNTPAKDLDKQCPDQIFSAKISFKKILGTLEIES